MHENDQQVTGERHDGNERPDATPQDAPMNEESEGPASSAAPEEEAPAYAPSGDELEAILERHRRWIESGGEEGACAGLHGNLREVDLIGANLERAYLTDADLRGAFLKGANLKDAELWDTNLEEAILVKANLEGAVTNGASFREAQLLEANLQSAELHGADFSEAYLQNANLEGARGLQVRRLRGANVSNATLPSSIAAFDGLGRVKDAAQYARKLFFTILATCVYCWLTIAMTRDAGLVTNAAASPLPIIGTTIPIVGFYWVASLTLLVLYVYFHLQLQRLWEELAALPAVFPDGQPLDKKADPWLLIGLVRAHLTHLKEEHLPFFSLQKGTLILVAWWVVPITLGFFGLRYLPKHDPMGTAFHLLLTVGAAWLAVTFYRNAGAALRGERSARFVWNVAWKDKRVLLTLVGSVAIWGLLTWAGSNGLPAADLEEVDLREADLRGARLEGARFFRADLRRSRLQRAKLQGADLEFAQLASANLSGANLTGAALREADLKEANLWRANLRQAALLGADLTGALLYSADLRQAYLDFAQLDSADLRQANLEGAVLWEADLRGANLEGAILSGADLGKHWLGFTPLEGVDGSVVDMTGLVDVTPFTPDSARGTDLHGANLIDVKLSNADLTGADFTEANLHFAQLDSANLSQADLREARGLSAKMICSAAELKGIKLDSNLRADVEQECPEELGRVIKN